MARWKLTQKHYLSVPGTEFEYKEMSATGRQVRKIYPVPMYLDPEDKFDCNYPGEIIVAHGDGKHESKDIIFTGPPTLDMTPLDEEAQEISAQMSGAWGRAFVGEDEEEGGYTNRLLHELTETLNSFNNTSKPSTAVASVDPELATKVSGLESQLTKMFEMNMALLAKLDPPSSKRI